jgi:hypothetical protein
MDLAASAYANNPSNIAATPIRNDAARQTGDAVAPKLRKEPSLCAICKRMVLESREID